MYDTVWAFAYALERVLAAGRSPHDGDALRAELLATDLEGTSGRIRLHPVTQDRIADLALYNVQQLPAASGAGLRAVEIRRPAIGPSAAANTTAASPPPLAELVQWPGGRTSTPVDGVDVLEVRTAAIHPFTTLGVPSTLAVESYCAAKLAEAHLLAGDASIVPEVASVSASRRLVLQPYNTDGTAQGGMRAYEEAIAHHHHAFIGPLYSVVAKPIALLSGGKPMLSPGAMSDELSDALLYRGFARTVVSSADFAVALVGMLQLSFYSWQALGVVYADDTWGQSMQRGIERACATQAGGHIRVAASTPYKRSSEQDEMRNKLSRLRARGVVIIVVAAYDQDLPALLAAAEESGMLEPRYAWILLETLTVVDIAATDAEFARRLHGLLEVRGSKQHAARASRLDVAALPDARRTTQTTAHRACAHRSSSLPLPPRGLASSRRRGVACDRKTARRPSPRCPPTCSTSRRATSPR